MRIFACLLVAPFAACMEAGERAATCPGWDQTCQTTCPAGETCSPSTPQGLHFGGAQTCRSTLSAVPLTTAVGGTQTITITGLNGLPFTVAVGGDAFTAVASADESVAITGVHDGSAELRILEPTTGQLYDRVSLDVATATQARLDVCGGWWFDEAPSHAIWVGSKEALQVQLQPSGGGLLADESMSIALPPSSTSYEWDSFTPASLAAGALAVDVTLTSGATLTATGDVVDHADAITFAPTFPTPPSAGLALGDSAFYAFTASLAGEAINGVPFTASTDAPLSIPPSGVIGDVVDVDAVAIGDGHLTISAGGAQATFAIPVVPHGTAAPAPHPLDAPRPGPAPGERARMLAAD
jgi:hypothetical protein